MYQEVIELLKNKNMTLGSAESFTGGLFASTITSYSGVSSFYKGSIISYWSEVKHDILNVSQKTIDQYGVVSRECAREMAFGLKKKLNVDIAISFTGNAGPSSMEGKPCGLIYIGFLFENNFEVEELLLDGTRNEIRLKAIDIAFNRIKDFLLKQ